MLKKGRVGKAERQGFKETEPRHQVAGSIYQVLLLRHATGMQLTCRTSRGDIVVTIDARYFLGDIHRTSHVLPPGRRSHLNRFRPDLDCELQFFQDINHGIGRDIGAKITIHPLRRKLELCRQYGFGIYVDYAWHDITGAHIGQQLRRPV